MATVFRQPIYNPRAFVPRVGGFVAPNLLLTTLAVAAVAMPFRPVDLLSAPKPATTLIRTAPPPNLLLTTLATAPPPAPFVQSNWQKPLYFIEPPQFTQPANLLLSTLGTAPPPAPFAQNLVQKTYKPFAIQPAQLPSLLLTTLATAPPAAPFVQNNWQKPLYFTEPPTYQQSPNLLLTTLSGAPTPAPFVQNTAPKPYAPFVLQTPQRPNLLLTTLAGAPVAAPFTQVNWQKSFPLIEPPAVQQPPNLLLTTLGAPVINFGIRKDIQALTTTALVEFFEIDLSPIGVAEQYYFHNDVNELGNDVVWQGQVYTRFPIEADGFERNGTGSQPRPRVRVGNITGLLGALAREHEDLVGVKFTRRRTFLKYLDAVNFASGNATADPNIHFTDEVWYVDRKASENRVYVEWELASAGDLTNVLLPRRQCIQNTCTWRYRSAECGYSGGAVADINDQPTTVLALDVCGKRLSSCNLRFPASAEKPFGGFPAVGLIR